VDVCGIVGLASRVPSGEDNPLEAMRDRLRHRGPDDAGAWWSPDRRVGLGHRRLAVIDLSPTGHQPMGDGTGRLWVTFNGELYNYRLLRDELEARGHSFRTTSDTEVLLEAYRAWGMQCLPRLNGMFAFALYDHSTRELVMARDRAGEKPLFYRHDGGQLLFASELKALMEHPRFPRELDREAFHHYLCYGYVPAATCILRGVRKLPPGHALRYRPDTDSLETWRYWELPREIDDTPADVAELGRRLEDLLLDSVRMRLVADVPVGILLSGGIDSSLITAMAARVSATPVKTFTVTFPGHGSYDEGPHAALVARHFGTRHMELVAEPATADLLPVLAEQFDEPIADSSMVPTYLVCRLIREHATVALGGDGGDELFGGYPQYSWIQMQERLRGIVPRPLRALAGRAGAHFLPVGFRGRNYVSGFAGDAALAISHVNLYFDRLARKRLLAPGMREAATPSPEEQRRQQCCVSCTPLQKATRIDFGAYLPDDILVKVDRASMLTSLEVRAPWLDHRIIEFAFGALPDRYRATVRSRKILPRVLARRLLPPDLDLKRKQGFSLPLDAWLKGNWGLFIAGVLEDADPQIFDRRAIRSLQAGQRRGLANSARLFSLTLFELWRRRYRVGLA
jgi:asparagine synthase (glutamine-hydrolysing)